MCLQEVGWRSGLNRSDSRNGRLACCCEQGDEPSGFIKCGEFLDLQRYCYHLNEESAA